METKLLSWKDPEKGVMKGFLTDDPSIILFHIQPHPEKVGRCALLGAFIPDQSERIRSYTVQEAQDAAEEYIRAWVGRNAATICRKTYGIPERDDAAGSLRISIETSSSYEAKVTINGRELLYSLQEMSWGYHSGEVARDEWENTIGGMVAIKISWVLVDILQGWIPEFENPITGECWRAWEKLDARSADEVFDKINP